MTDISAGMDLVTRGRLSVQRVAANAWDTIHLLAENGGWEEMDLKPRKKSNKGNTVKAPSKGSAMVRKNKKLKITTGEEDSPLSSLGSDSDEEKPDLTAETLSGSSSRKRKSPADNSTKNPPRRYPRRKVND